MDTTDLLQRLEGLETRLAFLDRTVEQLGEVLLERTEQLERLERKLAELDTRTSGPDEADPLSERPPHY